MKHLDVPECTNKVKHTCNMTSGLSVWHKPCCLINHGMDLVGERKQCDRKQQHFSGLQQCFLPTASELNQKMAADLSHAIRLPLRAVRACVCLSDVEIRCIPHSSPPFWNSDVRWGGGWRLLCRGPVCCVCFGAGG